MTSRVYGKQINLDSESVRNFWNSKSSKEGLQSVLLGKSGNDEPQKYRNFIETNLLVSLLEKRFFPLIGVIFGIENKKKKGIY